MNVRFFKHTQDGRVISSGFCPEGMVHMQHVPDGVFISIGDADPFTHHVLNGIPVPIPARPSANHVFNYTTKQWEPNIGKAEYQAKAARNRLLSSSDWTQLPDVPLATKDAWATYRQALRDITAQPGYPFNIIWPVAPA